MVESRGIKLIHAPLFGFLTLVSLITLAISASLVSHWNNNGYPNTSIRDRSRIILVATIWTTFFAAYLLVGVLVAAGSLIFGIFVHLITLLIGFILLLIGAASLTASTRHVNCGDVDNFSRCSVTKGLVGMTWVTTIIAFIALIFALVIGIKARSGAGMRRGTMTNA